MQQEVISKIACASTALKPKRAIQTVIGKAVLTSWLIGLFLFQVTARPQLYHQHRFCQATAVAIVILCSYQCSQRHQQVRSHKTAIACSICLTHLDNMCLRASETLPAKLVKIESACVAHASCNSIDGNKKCITKLWVWSILSQSAKNLHLKHVDRVEVGKTALNQSSQGLVVLR